MIFPGVLGAFCLILFLFASQVIPVNWAGVLLVLLAMGLFAAEVKVHSYGLLTVAGLAAMILGAMMLVDAPVREMRVPLRTLVPATAIMAAGTMALVRLVVLAQRRRPSTGREQLMGARGVAATDLAPDGWISVLGERVTVTAVEGLTLKVRKGA
jgi:membrane-bound serine protease (ClpP class)